MKREWILIVAGYGLTLVQSSLQGLVPFRILVPELGLLVALYAGLSAQGGASKACAVALCIGYVTDLLAGAPRGLHALVFVLLCLLAKGASLRLLIQSRGAIAVFAFIGSLLGALLLLVGRAGMAHRSGSLLLVPLQAVMTGLCAPLVFGLLRRLDPRPSKVLPGLS